MFLPEGVGSLVFRARDRLLRELAARRGIVVPSLVADTLVAKEEDEAILEAPAVADSAPSPGDAEAETVGRERVAAEEGAGRR